MACWAHNCDSHVSCIAQITHRGLVALARTVDTPGFDGKNSSQFFISFRPMKWCVEQTDLVCPARVHYRLSVCVCVCVCVCVWCRLDGKHIVVGQVGLLSLSLASL